MTARDQPVPSHGTIERIIRSMPPALLTLGVAACNRISPEGLMKSLMRLNGLDLPVPDHTHMSRRAAQLAVKIPRRPCKGLVLAAA